MHSRLPTSTFCHEPTAPGDTKREHGCSAQRSVEMHADLTKLTRRTRRRWGCESESESEGECVRMYVCVRERRRERRAHRRQE
eukprot:6179054-Pleurochrysis_carterae.AAC.1